MKKNDQLSNSFIFDFETHWTIVHTFKKIILIILNTIYLSLFIEIRVLLNLESRIPFENYKLFIYNNILYKEEHFGYKFGDKT